MKTINTAFKALSKNELSKIIGGEINVPDVACLPSGPSASVPVPTPLPGGTTVDTSGTATFQATSGNEPGSVKSGINTSSIKGCIKSPFPSSI